MGEMMSSEATTPESLATTRSGTLSKASAWMSAFHVLSYDAPTWSRYGGGWIGEIKEAQPPEPTSPASKAPRIATRGCAMVRILPRVVIDPAVGADEPPDPALVELVEGLEASPCGQRDARLHPGIGRQDDLVVVARHDGLELADELRTAIQAAVLDHDSAVLEIVDLELPRNRLGVDAPGRDIRHVRTRGRRVRIVGRDRLRKRLDVVVALVGELLARQMCRRPVGEKAHHDRRRHGRDPAPQPNASPPARSALRLSDLLSLSHDHSHGVGVAEAGGVLTVIDSAAFLILRMMAVMSAC